jgi:hypothetical protein
MCRLNILRSRRIKSPGFASFADMSIIRKRVIPPLAFRRVLPSAIFRKSFVVRFAMQGRIIINLWDKRETGRLGDWETGRLGEWATGRLGEWATGRHRDRETKGLLGDLLNHKVVLL